jgi:hypothetical protein
VIDMQAVYQDYVERVEDEDLKIEIALPAKVEAGLLGEAAGRTNDEVRWPPDSWNKVLSMKAWTCRPVQVAERASLLC